MPDAGRNTGYEAEGRALVGMVVTGGLEIKKQQQLDPPSSKYFETTRGVREEYASTSDRTRAPRKIATRTRDGIPATD